MKSFKINLTYDENTKKKMLKADAGWNDVTYAPSNGAAYVTGDGVTVIDIDTHDMSKIDKKLNKLLEGFKPNTITANGRHYYFKTKDMKSTSGIFKNVDIRSKGGIIYYEYTGEDKRISYEVQHTDIPKMPKKLRKYITKQPAMQGATTREVSAWLKEEPVDKPSLEEIIETVNHITGYEDREQWMRVGRALFAWDCDLGLGVFDTWSKNAKNYGGVDKFWNSLYGGNDHVTVGTLFYLAKLEGYHHVPVKKYDGLYTIVNADDFISDFKPSTWLIKGILPSSELGECFGASQSRKTFVVLDQAVCIQNGLEWQGNKTKQTDVLYICGEGVNGVRLRLAGFREHYDLEHNIDVLPVPVDMASNESMKELGKAIECRDKQYGLIIVDTLNANFIGDENSADEFGLMKSNLKEHICNDERMVMWVHHTGNTESGRARGSSARFAGVDFSMQVEAKGDLSVIKNKKMKDAEHFDEFNLAFKTVETGLKVDKGLFDEDVAMTSLVPVLASEEQSEVLRQDEAARVNKPTRVALDAYNNCEHIAIPQEFSNGVNYVFEDGETCVRYEDFRDDFMAHYDSPSQLRKWTREAIKDGKMLIYITQEGKGKERKEGYIYIV